MKHAFIASLLVLTASFAFGEELETFSYPEEVAETIQKWDDFEASLIETANKALEEKRLAVAEYLRTEHLKKITQSGDLTTAIKLKALIEELEAPKQLVVAEKGEAAPEEEAEESEDEPEHRLLSNAWRFGPHVVVFEADGDAKLYSNYYEGKGKRTLRLNWKNSDRSDETGKVGIMFGDGKNYFVNTIHGKVHIHTDPETSTVEELVALAADFEP